jgi:hypothetical protein
VGGGQPDASLGYARYLRWPNRAALGVAAYRQMVQGNLRPRCGTGLTGRS